MLLACFGQSVAWNLALATIGLWLYFVQEQTTQLWKRKLWQTPRDLFLIWPKKYLQGPRMTFSGQFNNKRPKDLFNQLISLFQIVQAHIKCFPQWKIVFLLWPRAIWPKERTSPCRRELSFYRREHSLRTAASSGILKINWN